MGDKTAIENAKQALLAWQQWEADLLMDDEAWRNSLPRISQDCWDAYCAIQRQREAALKQWPS